MRISATDIDDGNNGTVVYSLEPHRNAPGDADYFDISSASGEIKLKKKIDVSLLPFMPKVDMARSTFYK
jgi:hypothetical protein